MMETGPLVIITGTIAVVGALSTAVTFMLRGGISKQTIALMESNKVALEDRVLILEDSDKQKDKQIAVLEGEVKTLRLIPLDKIAQSLEKIVATQTAILGRVGEDVKERRAQ